VAVDTSDHTSLDLSYKFRETSTAAAQDRDLLELKVAVDVVELKNIQVGLTAIDARMRSQVRQNIFTIPKPILPAGTRAPRVVFRRIVYLVLPAIKRHARLAIRTPSTV
jgi:hypothetical protein